MEAGETVSKNKTKTDADIVRDANELARLFYSSNGYTVEKGYQFNDASHPQEMGMWALAVIAYEHIEGTDVEDALNNVESEEG